MDISGLDAARAAYPASGGGESALRWQLNRCEKELSGWINCRSATTPEGKEKIQEVSDRLARIKERLAQSEEAAARRRAGNAPPPGSAGTALSSPDSFALAGTGRVVDVRA